MLNSWSMAPTDSFHLDLRDGYDAILNSRHEGVLTEIGHRAWRSVVDVGVARGLLEPVPLQPPVHEIGSVARLMRGSCPRVSPPGGDLPFRRIGQELGLPYNDLVYRRALELPELFDLLQIHRNMKAHRSRTVTMGSLTALCGAVLMVLELRSDDWGESAQAESLREVVEQTLAVRSEDRKQSLRCQLADLQQKYDDLVRHQSSVSVAPGAVDGVDGETGIDDLFRAVSQKLKTGLDEIKSSLCVADDRRDRQIEQLVDAVAALRDDVAPLQVKDVSPVPDVTRSPPSQSGELPVLTGGIVRAKFRAAADKLERKHRVMYPANVFQSWIVNDALRVASSDGLATIDDWWRLPMVEGKRQHHGEMRRQLEIPGLADWMMDHYRRVERRPA